MFFQEKSLIKFKTYCAFNKKIDLKNEDFPSRNV